jgi:hypothetical protein
MEVHHRKAATKTIIQQWPFGRITHGSAACCLNFSGELLAELPLAALVVINGKHQLKLGFRVKEDLHQLNRLRISLKTSATGTGLTFPAWISRRRWLARSVHFLSRAGTG